MVSETNHNCDQDILVFVLLPYSTQTGKKWRMQLNISLSSHIAIVVLINQSSYGTHGYSKSCKNPASKKKTNHRRYLPPWQHP